MAFGKMPLEQIFDNNTSRVLDLLVANRPFEYTIDDFITILHLPKITVLKTLRHLNRFGLIERVNRKETKIAENPRTLALAKFIHETAVYNLDRISRQQSESKVDSL